MEEENIHLNSESTPKKESSIYTKSAFDILKTRVEAILFVADSPLEAGEIRAWIGEISLSDVRMALRAIALDYEHRAFELVELNHKYQIRTRNEHLPLIKKQYAGKARSLSKNALETLSIIAYRQPITRAQINALRQVDSSSIVQTLKDKDLIYASGTRKEVGNPLEYKTTQKFLDVFGLSSLNELPNLRSLQLNLDEQKKAALALSALEEKEEELPSAQDIGYSENEES
ncbi:SMC-Scp complex subunit ScpB [Fluviispira multicolorata]|uniref:SMC-Scp complex subunit ScpB n=1 Tax=Fluviispira multicolorata TaxID=2654512 RepID=A0A833JC48_9BACT|nr:SMC-Scp complex subunit ScpB [Fluviispira multicolorata]KAB8029073.1 SMC-Scp complex subunit ScpB [Fluviispira multicolorata]